MRKWIVVLIGVALVAELYWLNSYVNREAPLEQQPPIPASHPVQRLLDEDDAPQRAAQKQETLPRGPAEVRGILRGLDGEPVAGALVVATPLPGFGGIGAPEARPTWRATSTARGDFHISSLPYGDYLLLATSVKGGHLLEKVELNQNRPLAELRRNLKPSKSVQGRVVDARGRDIPKVRVIPIPDSPDSPEEKDEKRKIYAHLPAMTDDKGEFVLEHLAERPWRLLLRAEGYANALCDPFIPEGQRLALVMGSGAGLELALQLPGTEEPASGLRVELVEKHFGVERVKKTLDSGGKAVFAKLRPATWQIFVRESDYAVPDSLQEITLSGGESQTLTAVLRQGGRIVGRVVQGIRKEGMAGVGVEAWAKGGAGVWRTSTDESGQYRFQGLSPGKYEIVAHFPDEFVTANQVNREVLVSNGEEIEGPDFHLARGVSVQGNVLDSRGNAARDALVLLEVLGDDPAARETKTNAAGSFLFTGLREGQEVRLSASSGGMVSTPFGPNTVGRNNLSRVRLTLSQPNRGAIHGVVVDTQGRPVADAVVQCTPDEGRGLDTHTTRTGRFGGFQFNDLVPGGYTLTAGRSPGALATKNAWQVELGANDRVGDVQLLLP